MKNTLLLAFLFLSFSLISCQNTSQNSTTSANTSSKVLSVNEFEQALKNTANAQLVDVRTPEEVAQGSISGAINYDFYSDDFKAKMKSLDPSKPTFIYCKSGGRSGKTAKMLNTLEFKEVYDLKGGYTAWKASH